jgi:hypothetical protein
MVEFLAGDGKTAPVAINIDASQTVVPATDYRYVRPTDLPTKDPA